MARSLVAFLCLLWLLWIPVRSTPFAIYSWFSYDSRGLSLSLLGLEGTFAPYRRDHAVILLEGTLDGYKSSLNTFNRMGVGLTYRFANGDNTVFGFHGETSLLSQKRIVNFQPDNVFKTTLLGFEWIQSRYYTALQAMLSIPAFFRTGTQEIPAHLNPFVRLVEAVDIKHVTLYGGTGGRFLPPTSEKPWALRVGSWMALLGLTLHVPSFANYLAANLSFETSYGKNEGYALLSRLMLILGNTKPEQYVDTDPKRYFLTPFSLVASTTSW